MPRSGAADLAPGAAAAGLRLGFDVLRGFDYDGGHPSTEGYAPDGSAVTVPEHRHRVSLDLARIEATVGWAFDASTEVSLRAPYDVKQQRAGLRFTNPMTDAEMDAAWRASRLHHRTEVYAAFADFELLVSHGRGGLLRDGDALRMRLGLSLPVGRTERDPYARGAMGLFHRHVQFGTGTVDPIAELSYGVPVGGGVTLRASSRVRASLYENPKTYRGPFECSVSAGAAWDLGHGLAPHAAYEFLHQDIARWDGARDLNTGLQVHALLLGLSADLGGGFRLGADVRLLLAQRTLIGDGEAFEQGPTVLLSLRWAPKPATPAAATPG